MFKIDKNIPIYKTTKPKTKTDILNTFTEMEIGDSFYLPTPEKCKGHWVLQGTISTLAKEFRKSNDGFRVTTRKENKGLRIWRVK